jgi:PIN domain nuclease of toxin-antitoxin system
LNRTSASISSISIWEIGIKIKKGKLDIGISIEEFTRRLKKLGYIRIVPVDRAIWIRNLALEWDHSAPADRTIVATAQIDDLPILTKDEAIRRFKGIKTVW